MTCQEDPGVTLAPPGTAQRLTVVRFPTPAPARPFPACPELERFSVELRRRFHVKYEDLLQARRSKRVTRALVALVAVGYLLAMAVRL